VTGLFLLARLPGIACLNGFTITLPYQVIVKERCPMAVLLSNRNSGILWEDHRSMDNKAEVWQGTLALMVLKTLDTMGPLHGYGIARRIEQISEDRLSLNYGTLYPALLKLEQEGYVSSEWGLSDNNRRAKFYKLTRAGRTQLAQEARDWEQAISIVARFFASKEPA
jgi:transcriptional regulator